MSIILLAGAMMCLVIAVIKIYHTVQNVSKIIDIKTNELDGLLNDVEELKKERDELRKDLKAYHKLKE